MLRCTALNRSATSIASEPETKAPAEDKFRARKDLFPTNILNCYAATICEAEPMKNNSAL